MEVNIFICLHCSQNYSKIITLLFGLLFVSSHLRGTARSVFPIWNLMKAKANGELSILVANVIKTYC